MSQRLRVFVDFSETQEIQPGSTALLTREDSHHLQKVLRLGRNYPLTAVCRKSARQFKAEISSIGEEAEIRIISEIKLEDRKPRVISLIYALCKGKKNDFVCEKACELGLQHIIFWQAERSVMRIRSERDKKSRLKRWRKIAESAARQSDKAVIPSVYLALDLNEVLEVSGQIFEDQDMRLFCSLSEQAREFKELTAPSAGVHLLVGPEGDISPQEEKILLSNFFKPVTLGPYTLRSDTAAISAISISQGLWGYSL